MEVRAGGREGGRREGGRCPRQVRSAGAAPAAAPRRRSAAGSREPVAREKVFVFSRPGARGFAWFLRCVPQLPNGFSLVEWLVWGFFFPPLSVIRSVRRGNPRRFAGLPRSKQQPAAVVKAFVCKDSLVAARVRCRCLTRAVLADAVLGSELGGFVGRSGGWVLSRGLEGAGPQ